MGNYYGWELILDLHECEHLPTTREQLREFMTTMCNMISMEAEDLHFWDYADTPEEYEAAPAHLAGISAVQFISTSNITLHTVDKMKQVYINIFSCKSFDAYLAAEFCACWFGGRIAGQHLIVRR